MLVASVWSKRVTSLINVASSVEVHKTEVGVGVSAHDGGLDVGSCISVTDEAGCTLSRIAIKLGIEVEEQSFSS
jgi:hypothetical protein